MKIGKTPEQASAAAIATAAEKARTTTPASTSGVASAPADEASAQVALSNTATSLIGTSENTADFDSNKVASVASAIDNGSYKVNAHVIADKLLANARELLSKAAQ